MSRRTYKLARSEKSWNACFFLYYRELTSLFWRMAVAVFCLVLKSFVKCPRLHNFSSFLSCCVATSATQKIGSLWLHVPSNMKNLPSAYVFSGYKNQTNIARKLSRVVGETIREKPELQTHTFYDNMVPWDLRALGTKTCHLRHVFSGYKNQTNMARKLSRVAGETIREKPELQTCTHVFTITWCRGIFEH